MWNLLQHCFLPPDAPAGDAPGGSGSAPNESSEGGGTSDPPVDIEALRAEQKAAAERAEAAERARDEIREVLHAITSNMDPNITSAEPKEEPDDFPDIEELDGKTLKTFMQKQINKALQEQERKLIGSFQQFAQAQNQRWAGTERERVTEELKALGLEEHIQHMDTYLKESGVSPEVLAAPGVHENAAALVIGKAFLEKKKAEASRASNLSSVTSGFSEYVDSTTAEEERRWLEAHGIKVNDDQWNRIKSLGSTPTVPMMKG